MSFLSYSKGHGIGKSLSTFCFTVDASFNSKYIQVFIKLYYSFTMTITKVHPRKFKLLGRGRNVFSKHAYESKKKHVYESKKNLKTLVSHYSPTHLEPGGREQGRAFPMENLNIWSTYNARESPLTIR